jgi:RNA polymerase sigma factor (sigma-70 family)
VPVRAESLAEIEDEDLLRACLGGEELAWNELIDRYSALIYSIPLKYGLGDADAADVFQSVWVTLLEKLGSIRAPRGLAAWIITTTSRQCLAVARQRRRDQQRSMAVRVATADVELVDPDLLPEEELLGLERERVIRMAIKQLPEACRHLIDALFTDGPDHTSYQRLADSLGMPMNSLGPTRARCLEKLRRLLLAAGYITS